MQSQFVKIDFECKKLKYNFNKPAILSWMLLDILNEGKISNSEILEWIVNNILVESELINDLALY